MVETAAHHADHVFPRLSVRQWVLSVPKRLRYFMQRDGAVLNMVLRIFLRVIAQSLQDHCAGSDHWTSLKRVLVAVSFRCGLDLRLSHVKDRNGSEAAPVMPKLKALFEWTGTSACLLRWSLAGLSENSTSATLISPFTNLTESPTILQLTRSAIAATLVLSATAPWAEGPT